MTRTDDTPQWTTNCCVAVGNEPTPCPSCGGVWFHKEGCTDEH